MPDKSQDIMRDRIKSWFAGWRAKSVSTLIDLFTRCSLSDPQTLADYLRLATRKVWATWKSCQIIASVVQTTPFAIYREGAKDPVKVPDLQKLLRYANENDTFADLLYLTVFHLIVTGSAYWYKSDATLKGDRPKELIPLNPKRMRRAINTATGEQLGWRYIVNGTQNGLGPAYREQLFDMDEIMVFRLPHPDNDYAGLGHYEAGIELINEFVNRQEFGKQFWKNGAAPSSVMVLDDLMTDQGEWEKAKAKWAEQYGGQKNAGKVAWLTGKWRIERLGLTAQEMQDIERSRFTLEQIFMLHGVPLSVAGLREAANFATAEIDDQRFRTYTVMPIVRIIQDTMNTDLVTGWGENLSIRFELAGLVDLQKVVSYYMPLFDRGAVSINEIRKLAGLPVIDDDPQFDEHFISAGLVPLALAGISAAGDPTDRAAQRTTDRFIEKVLTGKP